MKTLLNHPRPYPQESLASWLWCLTNANYIDSPSLLLLHLSHELARPKPFMQQILTKLKSPEWFHGLATLTYTNASTIYETTLHRFAQALTLPGQEAMWMSLTTGDIFRLLPANTNRGIYSSRFSWCPHCLAETSYVRLHWYVPLLTCCTSHACWLLEVCPQCGTRPGEANILKGCCKQCGFVFAKARTMAVPETDLLFQQCAALMMWLYDAKSPQTGLPDVPVNALLRVLQGLRYCVQRAGEDWRGHHLPPNIPVQNVNILERRELSIYERGCLYSTAFRALLNWPRGFYAFLDAYRQRPVQLEESGLRLEFGSLHSSWMGRFWKAPEFDWIQNAYNEYLVDKMPVYQIVYSQRSQDYPELIEQIAYLDLNRTRKYLKSSVLSIYRLVDEGHLTLHRFEDDVDGVWFARQELDELQQRWQQHIRLLDLAHLLGLSKRLVHELIDAGLLSTIPSSVGLKQQGPYLHRDSLHNFIQQLKQHTIVEANAPHDSVSLLDVCIRNGSVKLDLVRLLERVLLNKLPAYHSNETLLPLSEMWFMVEDVKDLSLVVKDEQDWMNLTEAQACLGIGRRVFGHLLETGLLQPQQIFGRKQIYRTTDILALRERCVTSEQTVRILGIALSYIFKLVRLESLKPISGPSVNQHGHYLFDRQEVLNWKAQYVMYNEMKTVTTDIDALMRFLKQQGIQSVVGPPHVYMREEVMDSIEQLQIGIH